MLEQRLDILSRHGAGTYSEHLHRVQQHNRELQEELEHVRARLAQMQVQTGASVEAQSNVDPKAQVDTAASHYMQTSDLTGYGVASSAALAAGESVKGDQEISFDLTNSDLSNEQPDPFIDEKDGARAYWIDLPRAKLQSVESVGGQPFGPGIARFASSNGMGNTLGADAFASRPGFTMDTVDSRGFFSVEQQHAASPLTTSIPAVPLAFWARTPLYYTSPNPLDRLIKEAMEAQWASGLPLPTDPDYSALFAPRKPQSMTQSLNDALVKAIRLCAFESIAAQAAMLYISHVFWGWLIWPSPASYARLPVYMRPVRRQLEIPHPSWSDAVYFPLLRDRVMADQPRYISNEFITSYTESVRIRWPSRAEPNALIFTMTEDGWLGLTPGFQAAVRDFRCWMMSPKFFRRFPECQPLVQVSVQALE
jgi:hypothetical protein